MSKHKSRYTKYFNHLLTDNTIAVLLHVAEQTKFTKNFRNAWYRHYKLLLENGLAEKDLTLSFTYEKDKVIVELIHITETLPKIEVIENAKV